MEIHCDIDDQLRRKLFSALDQHADPQWRQEVRRCVPRVVALVNQAHDRPLEQRVPEVRAILRDQCMVGGDGAMLCADEEALGQHVTLLVREMEKVRHVQLRRGDWSDAPVPPQMYG